MVTPWDLKHQCLGWAFVQKPFSKSAISSRFERVEIASCKQKLGRSMRCWTLFIDICTIPSVEERKVVTWTHSQTPKAESQLFILCNFAFTMAPARVRSVLASSKVLQKRCQAIYEVHWTADRSLSKNLRWWVEISISALLIDFQIELGARMISFCDQRRNRVAWLP